jgi:hypothetical protein
MNYFEAMISTHFKTDKQGRPLFFPWLNWGRGYVIASQQEAQRLRRYIRFYIIAGLMLVIGATATHAGLLGGLAASVPVFVVYTVWAALTARRMQPTQDE